MRGLAYLKSQPDAMAVLQSGIDANADRRSQLLLVTMTGTDPHAITEIANAAVRSYMRIEGGNEATSEDERLRALERERDASSEKLRTLCEQARQMGQEYGTTDLAAREQAVLARIQSLQEDLAEAQTDRMSLQYRARRIEDEEAAPPSPSGLVRLKDDTVNATHGGAPRAPRPDRQGPDDPEAAGKDETPEDQVREREIEALKAKLAAVRKEAEARFDDMMARETAVQLETGARDIAAGLAQLDMRVAQVQAEMEKRKSRLITLNRRAPDIKKVQDEMAIANDLYRTVVTRIQQLQVERRRPARIRVAYTAEQPRYPSRDKRWEYGIVLVMGALVFGCALSLLCTLVPFVRLRDVVAEPRVETGGTSDSAAVGADAEKDARSGDAEAQWHVANMAYNRKDYAAAAGWYRRAAAQGYARAHSNLGAMAARGQGLARSQSVAADWFYSAGRAFMKEGSRERALACCDKIRLVAPDSFLAGRLLEEIYGESAQGEPAGPRAGQRE